ncbi:microfibril-associated glycoprotein 4-like isoform X1 [Carassius auratus]|uniref:Microfibril-associated glycoprotein 4-like isoform X1 n=1 Tax=Carassius auratus TaxID=7957 RepID=A0A6P6N4G3_CARAU|nr:microfibril-associated glycoprotein 4-like isoform X1 [Carassius auratus]
MAMKVFAVALLSVFMGFMVSVSDGLNPVDCSDIYKSGQTISGIYSIYPAGDVPVWVYCEMISVGNNKDKGGWTVIQRRMDGSVNFYRPWNQSKRGFGNVQGEYWLGLENMYQLTRNRNYTLRVDLEDFKANKVFALYSSFSVGPEAAGYKLHVSGFKNGGAGDSLSFHNGQKFTTLDKDQDVRAGNCAKLRLGAFWYKDCLETNPNGVYIRGEDGTHFAIGNVWLKWKKNNVGMKFICMKIRRVS